MAATQTSDDICRTVIMKVNGNNILKCTNEFRPKKSKKYHE
jgi:hypothetical protein